MTCATDPELTERLRRATQTLLDSLPTVMEDGLPFSDALHGGAQHVCDGVELDYAWAPMIEAETVRTVTREAGHGEPALFTPELSRAVQRIESLPWTANGSSSSGSPTATPTPAHVLCAVWWLPPSPRPGTPLAPGIPAGPNVLPFTPRPQGQPPRSPGR